MPATTNDHQNPLFAHSLRIALQLDEALSTVLVSGAREGLSGAEIGRDVTNADSVNDPRCEYRPMTFVGNLLVC